MIPRQKGVELPRDLSLAFDIPGRLTGCRTLSGGLIHDTYLCAGGGAVPPVRYVVQCINTGVFPAPEALMKNVQRVSAHLREKVTNADGKGQERRIPTLVPARDGRLYWIDADGNWWRSFEYIEGAQTYETATSSAVAEGAAFAFGTFARLMSDLPPPPLQETISGFHNIPERYQELKNALNADSEGRMTSVSRDIEFALAREQGARILFDLEHRGALKKRVAHNDTKLSNVLFDVKTARPLCVIDLDTVMPGLLLHDFGDLVRSVGSRSTQDDGEGASPGLDLMLFGSLVRGYLVGVGDLFSNVEIELMPTAARVITLELGVRFLTDYLQGDVYFRIRRPQQNLERARTQFQLLRDLEAKHDTLIETVARAREETTTVS